MGMLATRRRCTMVLAAMLGAAAVSACGAAGQNQAGATAKPSSVSAPSLEACVLPAYHAREVAFPVGSEQIVGAEFGSGSVGIVMSHEYRADLCGWAPYAAHLASLGYRALAFDFGTDLVQDVIRAATQIHKDGADKVILMGASMGGTASLVAAQSSTLPIAAVASLSGPAQFQGMDAMTAVTKLQMPVLFLAGQQDVSFAQDARTLYAACASSKKQLHVYQGNDHGTQLLQFSVAQQVQAQLDSFVSSV